MPEQAPDIVQTLIAMASREEQLLDDLTDACRRGDEEEVLTIARKLAAGRSGQKNHQPPR